MSIGRLEEFSGSTNDRHSRARLWRLVCTWRTSAGPGNSTQIYLAIRSRSPMNASAPSMVAVAKSCCSSFVAAAIPRNSPAFRNNSSPRRTGGQAHLGFGVPAASHARVERRLEGKGLSPSESGLTWPGRRGSSIYYSQDRDGHLLEAAHAREFWRTSWLGPDNLEVASQRRRCLLPAELPATRR